MKKESLNKEINLRCTICGDTDFDFNTDQSFIKCNRCGREYNGGYDELVNLNQEYINQEFELSAEEFLRKTKADIIKDFNNPTQRNKFITIK